MFLKQLFVCLDKVGTHTHKPAHYCMHVMDKREKMLRLKSMQHTITDKAKIMLPALPKKNGIHLKMIGGLLKMRSSDKEFFTERKKNKMEWCELIHLFIVSFSQ